MDVGERGRVPQSLVYDLRGSGDDPARDERLSLSVSATIRRVHGGVSHGAWDRLVRRRLGTHWTRLGPPTRRRCLSTPGISAHRRRVSGLARAIAAGGCFCQSERSEESTVCFLWLRETQSRSLAALGMTDHLGMLIGG